MMIRFCHVPVLLATLVAASCSAPDGKKPGSSPPPFGPSGVPPALRPKNSPEAGTPIIPGGNQPAQPVPSNMTPDSDIVFTDPDNPDASIPELATLLSAPKIKSWEESETLAKQRASREGKPILIWFTDSARSPMCKALSQELFSTPDFERWAAEKIIRLRVDSNIKITDSTLSMDDRSDREIQLREYVEGMKKRYKVLGYPSVIMINPGGEVLGRYRGYKRGNFSYFWGQLKHSQAVAENAYQTWRTGLVKKGYREWEDRKGRKVFARLTSYSKGEIVFVEPDGTRSRTRETLLSNKDRDWLDSQKKLHGL